ncbi:MAG: hypothetical protein M3308_00320 [Actinomycetota bacterium]|nr:hypothetical protein [Actinomycetota bacterium]
MTGRTYPATPYLRRLTADNGGCSELIRDRHGEPVAIVAVRRGPHWTDAVAIEGEDRCVAMRHRARDARLIVPSEPPDGCGAVWSRDRRCADVLAELFELRIPPVDGGP